MLRRITSRYIVTQLQTTTVFPQKTGHYQEIGAFMKKILAGFLILGSLASFAETQTCEIDRKFYQQRLCVVMKFGEVENAGFSILSEDDCDNPEKASGIVAGSLTDHNIKNNVREMRSAGFNLTFNLETNRGAVSVRRHETDRYGYARYSRFTFSCN
jgi:hypothetical protein